MTGLQKEQYLLSSTLNITFFRTISSKSSNQSFKTDMAHYVKFMSILFYFIYVSVIQNFEPLYFSLFAAFLSLSFLDRRRELSLFPRLEITIFSKNVKVNVKLNHSGLGVRLWSRPQISLRHLVTEDAGLINDLTTCRAKIQECRVLRNTWIRGKKASFLDDGQIC